MCACVCVSMSCLHFCVPFHEFGRSVRGGHAQPSSPFVRTFSLALVKQLRQLRPMSSPLLSDSMTSVPRLRRNPVVPFFFIFAGLPKPKRGVAFERRRGQRTCPPLLLDVCLVSASFRHRRRRAGQATSFFGSIFVSFSFVFFCFFWTCVWRSVSLASHPCGRTVSPVSEILVVFHFSCHSFLFVCVSV